MATLRDLIVYGPSHLIGPAQCSSIYAIDTTLQAANKYFATNGTIQTVSAGDPNRAISINSGAAILDEGDNTAFDIMPGAANITISPASNHGQILIKANGYTYTSTNNSVSMGVGTTAAGSNLLVIGKYNVSDTTNQYAFIIGGGAAAGSPENKLTVDWEGNLICATGSQFATSDIRKKDIIDEISLNKCYDLINNCQEILYTLKSDESKKEQIGVIAQEIEEYFPEIVLTDQDGFKSLDYSRLSIICLRALKDVIKRLENLENK